MAITNEGDPRMIEFVLKSFRPERYRERIEAAVVGAIVISPQKADGDE